MASKGKVTQLKAQEAQRRISREELLRPRIEDVEAYIEALGGTVLIRPMSVALRDEIRSLSGFNTDDWDEDRFTMLSIVRSVVDPKLTEDDIKALSEQNAGVVDEIIMNITLINMTGRARDLKKG